MVASGMGVPTMARGRQRMPSTGTRSSWTTRPETLDNRPHLRPPGGASSGSGNTTSRTAWSMPSSLHSLRERTAAAIRRSPPATILPPQADLERHAGASLQTDSVRMRGHVGRTPHTERHRPRSARRSTRVRARPFVVRGERARDRRSAERPQLDMDIVRIPRCVAIGGLRTPPGTRSAQQGAIVTHRRPHADRGLQCPGRCRRGARSACSGRAR